MSGSKNQYTSVRQGLTLLELLIVLVILSIVATVAVNSMAPRVESERFSQTRSLLQNIQQATVGTVRAQQADGTPLISGFISDVGRLPRLTISRQQLPGMELAELWDDNSVLAKSFPYRFRSGPRRSVDYSAIQLPCGWRGPYLHLPIGQPQITDPWGRPFEMGLDADSCIESVSWNPLPQFETPIDCSLKIGKVTVSGTINFGQSVPSLVTAVLLGPNPDSSLTELAVFADEDSVGNTFMFSDVAVGVRAIHVSYDGRQLTKYIHVPHDGLTLIIDLTQPANDASP